MPNTEVKVVCNTIKKNKKLNMENSLIFSIGPPSSVVSDSPSFSRVSDSNSIMNYSSKIPTLASKKYGI